MLIVLLVVLAGIFIFSLGLLLRWSPRKPRPFADANGKILAGSVSEKIRVDINGLPQGMFVKGKDETNPVLLFLHGGPGMPEYFLAHIYPTGLENHFTVCWWERHGVGLSYRPDILPETMTVEQEISDTLEVTSYLRERFHKEKVCLLAHSGGSFIGIQAAARAPHLYYAYVGMSQMSYQLESERLAYEYMLRQFTASGKARMARKLEAAPVSMTALLPAAYNALRDEAMHSLGIGTTHAMRSVVSGIFLPVMKTQEYTFRERLNIWRGKAFAQRLMWDKIVATDLRKQVTRLDLPVYFLHGLYDYTVSYTLAKSYFEQLQAPLKGFYTFERSAHSPLFEEPEKALRILQQDVLAGMNRLADAE